MTQQREAQNPIIEVQVESFYVDRQQKEMQPRYVFAYHVTIKNNGTTPAILHSRHWIITHANGRSEEVQGLGVVGQQPKILPGDSFEYTSGAILETPMGTMHGSYLMLTETGEPFDAPIVPFRLIAEEVVFH